ncbi:MAG TPA: HAD family hydrolase [Smithellaceae bacterium]|nr:HAD family hydrolase [Smithellaceae bacterium]
MSLLQIKNTHIHAIIFDFDGTLARLNIDFSRMRNAIRELLSSYGIDGNQLANGFVLEIIKEAQALLNRQSEGAASVFVQRAYRIIEAIELEAAERGDLFPATRKLLQELRFAGIACAIITRNCRAAIVKTFPDISDYCAAVVCRDNVDMVKPHPEHINKALNIIAIPRHHTLMIGDHPLDIATGKNAGTLTAGVLTGHFKEEDFLKSGADLVLKEAGEILKMIKRPEEVPKSERQNPC